MFLTQDEIRELTGYKVYKCQQRWLTRQGIKFLTGYDGKPRVMVAHLEQIMGAKDKSERKKTEPNFSCFDNMRIA